MSLPQKIWNFSKDDFCLHERPDPGTLVVLNTNYIFSRRIAYIKEQKFISKTELFIEKPLCDLIEFISRRILGSCLAAVSFLVLPPIGFIAKVLHFSTCQISNSIGLTALSQKISQIWDDVDLVGHSLTSAPGKWYQFTAAPLSWHLRTDGTDRRGYRAEFGPNGNRIQESEYVFVPFELFECIYRTALGGTLILVSSIASPIGLIAKSIHLMGRSIFSQCSRS